jgi:hypothetical protein
MMSIISEWYRDYEVRIELRGDIAATPFRATWRHRDKAENEDGEVKAADKETLMREVRARINRLITQKNSD